MGESVIRPLEQHDELYRKAYQAFLSSNLKQAKKLAEEALSRFEEFRRLPIVSAEMPRSECRAQNLLKSIEKTMLAESKPNPPSSSDRR